MNLNKIEFLDITVTNDLFVMNCEFRKSSPALHQMWIKRFVSVSSKSNGRLWVEEEWVQKRREFKVFMKKSSNESPSIYNYRRLLFQVLC